ncbi:DUF4142 domain-containing protein [Acetobacteraceae bacterium ESL0709]|nr:DUF4142 domain-containing protein [Acetobacteraceae bacterium ESL0697]MDF7678423.1 DUF4142 domain-containing protein [Acetobacteraceae bacterium ESL0709]
MKIQKFAVVISSLFLYGCAAPSPPPPPALPIAGTEKPISLTMADLMVLDQMNRYSAWMVSLGTLVATHSNQPVVLAYGTRLVTDYKNQQDSFKKVSQKHLIALTDALSDSQVKKLSSLSRLYGRSFDRAFMRETVKKLPVTILELQENSQKVNFSKDIKALWDGFMITAGRFQKQSHDLLTSE